MLTRCRSAATRGLLVVERITLSLSTVFVQLRAQGATPFALRRDPPFAADYPVARSTVDFQ